MRKESVCHLIGLSVALMLGSSALAQEYASSEGRAPRFLYAPTASSSAPVALDVSRTPMLMRRIAVDLDGVPLKQALSEISARAGLTLVYPDGVVPADRVVSLRADRISVVGALTDVLADLGVDVVFNVRGGATLVKRTKLQARLSGTITGRVTDSSTNEPVTSAHVSADGTRSTTTSAEGRYALTGVAAGERTVTVRRLGYRTRSQIISLTDGASVAADFKLVRTPTQLTEVVSTATGDRQRIELGNAIGTINADSIVPLTQIRNLSDLLASRVSGVVVSTTTGLAGAPSKIRIRGVNSVSLNNDPILIVDGVRVLAQTSEARLQTNIGSQRNVRAPETSGIDALAPSRLDDIDPSIIESIDVLRGPSAATLYGTEAANGVVVIRTKRGTSGPWTADLTADLGQSAIAGDMPLHWISWGRMLNGATTNNCVLFNVFSRLASLPTVTDGTCIQDSVTAFNAANHPDLTTLGSGRTRNVSGSLSGGTDRLRQYLSLRSSDELGMSRMSNAEQRRYTRLVGSEPPSWMMRPNTDRGVYGSSRTTASIKRGLDISLSVNAVYRNTLAGNTGLAANGAGNGFNIALQESDTLTYVPSEEMRPKQTTVAKRGYGSLNIVYAPLEWLTARAQFGGDYTLRADEALLQTETCTGVRSTAECLSGRRNQRAETFVSTVDVGAQAAFAPLSWLSLRTAVGEQVNKTRFSSIAAANTGGSVLAFGSPLLSPPPVVTFTGAQLYDVTEGRDESATAGWYLEQTASARERLFLSLGVRQDVASAFGKNVNDDAPSYPKAGLSWLVSDEGFFPSQNVLSRFRLRAAYGHSGAQASRSAVLPTFVLFNALAPDGITVAPGVQMSTIGNRDLQPERTTELEGGFDASLFDNDRLQLEGTIYRKLTRDAIMSFQLPHSVATGVQQRNVGSVENRGLEASVTARIVEARSLGWELTANISRNRNKLVRKSPSLITSTSPGERLVEGHPLNAMWGFRLRSFNDANGDGLLSYSEVTFGNDLEPMGAPYPTAELSYINHVTLLNGALRLSANVNQVVGLSNPLPADASSGHRVAARGWVDPTSSLAVQAAAWEALQNGAWLIRTSTVRLSEASLSYMMPQGVAHRYLHARTASVVLAGRNLAMATNYMGKDPNVSFGLTDSMRDDGRIIPQPRTWTVRLNLGY